MIACPFKLSPFESGVRDTVKSVTFRPFKAFRPDKRQGLLETGESRKRTLQGDSLVEVRSGVSETLNMDFGVSINSHTEALIHKEKGVESGVLDHIPYIKFLADVHCDKLVRGSLRHLEVSKGDMAGPVLKIQRGIERTKGSVYAATAGNRRVHLHMHGFSRRLRDAKALYTHFRIVQLALDDIGKPDEYTALVSYLKQHGLESERLTVATQRREQQLLELSERPTRTSCRCP